MSVLVRGMEMPWCCAGCPFISDPVELSVDIETYRKIYKCTRAPEEIDDPWRSESWIMGNREKWCPLDDVPVPHGDLIDADVLISKINNGYYSDDLGQIVHSIGMQEVKEAPTIIEAEGEDA